MNTKNILLLKSEPISYETLEQFQLRGFQVTQVNLIAIEYTLTNDSINEEYDYVCLNSVNSVEALARVNYHFNSKFIVVGNKTAQKLKTLQAKDVVTFNNQSSLHEYLLNLNPSRVLYIVGDLSERDLSIQNLHQIKYIIGYENKFNHADIQNQDKFQFIVYFSRSNYNYYQQIRTNFDENVRHIFWGQKCAENNLESNYIILKEPTFDDLFKQIP